MRASGVFTGTTNSPSRLPRQSLYHSTIRAGRNLPDKEFRSSFPTLFSREDGLYLSLPVFITEAISRISETPSVFKCFPWFIRCRIFRNLAKSTRLFDL